MTDHDRAPAVLYDVKDRKAYLTLNPPDRLNAIGSRLPGELVGAVRKADIDPDVLTMLFDGITWYSPEGCWFQEFAATYGSHEAVKWRDTSRWSPTADDLEEG